MEIIEAPSFGHLLRSYRRAAAMTEERLAERTDLSVRAIGDLERDVGHIPRRDTMESLIDALDLAPGERRQFEMAARGKVDTPARARGERRPPQLGSFLGAFPPGPLIGREHERRRILPLIDAVAGENGRFVMLVGEPGVGKTRLAQEVALETWNQGFCVATGRCYEPERTVPFYPFLEALSTAYAAAPDPLREQVTRQRSHLARLLPGGRTAGRASSTSTSRMRAALGRTGPTGTCFCWARARSRCGGSSRCCGALATGATFRSSGKRSGTRSFRRQRWRCHWGWRG